VRILLTGVSGFAGQALLPRLLDQGHDVRALARDRSRVERALESMTLESGLDVALTDFELVIGDTLSGAGMVEAMREIEVAYYLIHSMEPAGGAAGGATAGTNGTATAGTNGIATAGTNGIATAGALGASFPARERASAETFAQAARAAGVGRIVYLGGPPPRAQRTSTHLSSRYAVERILMDAVPNSVALRASIVIGARSRSFRFLVRLVERLRVLALPAWRNFRTQPIDERDVLAMLAACAANEAVAGRSLDVGGPDVLSYGEMVERIAELMMLARPSVGLGLTVTPIAARVAAALTNERPELVLPLMEGLTRDLLTADDDASELLGVELHSFDSAVEHALYEWEKVERLAAR
jgi:uncharacterized protein YbjT (DUF2867 family)